MSFLDVWGWVCALCGMALSLPQLLKLFKVRTSAGLSLLAWQIMVGLTAAWILYGVLGHTLQIWVPNLVSCAGSTAILWLIKQDRRLSFLSTFGVAALIGAGLMLVYVGFGAALFGTIMLIPQTVNSLGQLREIARALDLSGLSVPYLVVGVILPAVWLAWGVMKPDAALMISSGGATVMGVLNLGWYLARKAGHGRPLAPAAATEDAVVLDEGPAVLADLRD